MLILLPGMDGTGRMFEPFTRLLPAECEFRAIAYPADAPVSYPELAAFVAEQLPRRVPLTIMAESFSGPVALLLGERSDLQIETVVLVSSFAASPAPMLACLPLTWFLRLPRPGFLIRKLLAGETASRALCSAIREATASVPPPRARRSLACGRVPAAAPVYGTNSGRCADFRA